ncbi:MAG: RICIN domain-containing protein [Myxococcota bacterium]
MRHQIFWLSLAVLTGCEEGVECDTAVAELEEFEEFEEFEELPLGAGNAIPVSSPCGMGFVEIDGRIWVVSASGSCRMTLRLLSGQVISFINERSAKCIDVAGGSTANNAAVNQFRCHTGSNQQFYVHAPAGSSSEVQLIPMHTYGLSMQRCLDIAAASTRNNAALQQFSCNGGDNQMFHWNIDDKELVVDHSGKCIDVPGGSTLDGVRLQQYDCHGGDNQKWNIYSVTTGYVY